MNQTTSTAQTVNKPHPTTYRAQTRQEDPQGPTATTMENMGVVATLREAMPLWAWSLVAVAFPPLALMALLAGGPIRLLPAVQANAWADFLLGASLAVLAWGSFVLAAWSRRQIGWRRLAWIAAVPATLTLGGLTFLAFLGMAGPGYAFLEAGTSVPQNGLWDLPWDQSHLLPQASLLPEGLAGLLLLGVLPVAAWATLLRVPGERRIVSAGAPARGESSSPSQGATRGAGATAEAFLVAQRVAMAPTAASLKPKTNGHSLHNVDPHAWMKREGIASSADIPLPELLIDEVIGQDEAVEVAKKAARQRRHLLLLGDPGTGKSMIAKAMAQILPPAHLDDVLLAANPKDENVPNVKVLPGGQGRAEFAESQSRARRAGLLLTVMEWTICFALVGGGIFAFFAMGGSTPGLMLIVICLIAAIFFMFVTRQFRGKPQRMVPNLLIERPNHAVPAPYVDATGSHHGALLGDVRHDPFQSGGLQTPTHLRVEPGAIHRAHKGLLFIDEINVLRLDSQQALLTAMQEKRYAITGQSERSSGAMARTDPVPCDFVLVAAGNMDVIAPSNSQYQGLHPALRSRIRGYGYEVYVRSVMDDTDDNRRKLVRFVAQEVRRDGRIPHFDGAAVAEVLREAQRRSGHSGKLTLRLRELGGLVRTAGDIARDADADLVTVDHVLAAKRISMSLEYQVTRRGIEVSTAKEALLVGGEKVGAAVGCAFMGTGETGEPAGIVVPVEADATISSNRQKGTLYLGGGLERDNGVSDSLGAVLKRFRGADMAGLDLHVQALLQQPNADVQALAATAAVACVSALEGIPVRQDTVVLGAVAVSGRLRAVEGVTQMIEGAADLGYTHAVVPAANANDILLEHHYKDRIEVHLAADLGDALGHALAGPPARRQALQGALRGGGTKPTGKAKA